MVNNSRLWTAEFIIKTLLFTQFLKMGGAARSNPIFSKTVASLSPGVEGSQRLLDLAWGPKPDFAGGEVADTLRYSNASDTDIGLAMNL
ncbi:hypothetical protein TNCV_4254061 [Trichonephila clavipes]|nr:hypothetical protein TNCV_4254061 [Trichonephila clavipes]